MKTVLVILLIMASYAWCKMELVLARIQVHEWGVLTLGSTDPVLSSVPGTPSPVVATDSLGSGGEAGLLRAPVLYFHGPAFSGTVTINTNNGSIFDIYPTVPDADRDHNHCTWTAVFNNMEITEYPDFHGMAPGEWNYDQWREVYALSISSANGWNDKFLYYETAPESIDFLPYSPAKESLCEEYMNVEAMIIQRRDEGIFLARCTLGDVVYGSDIQYTELDRDDAVLGVLFDWSAGILEADEVEALWNTWETWIFREYIYEPGFENGLLMYRIPDELTEKLSVISVSPDEVEFPVDISRYLLVAMPFRGEQ
jgi:hypothetical protein